jgi:hypothetical protein
VVRIITISAGEKDNGFSALVPCICPIVLKFIQSLITLVGTVERVVVAGSAKMIAETIKKYIPNRGKFQIITGIVIMANTANANANTPETVI